jgi:NAD(P)-dependent dehydrogenase (short-subunit alcohol dehydrogenase family)
VTLRADLGREAETSTLIGRAEAALGRLRLLVNNASTFDRDGWNTADRASWDHHMEPNLRAPFVLIQGFARQLPEPEQGNVINLLDQRVWNPTPAFITYTLSKIGLWGLTQTLALALAPRIRVNGIGPGPALPSPRQTQAQFDEQCASLPLQRGTSPEEICRAVRFLLASPSLTGQMIALDGGQHLGWAPPAKGWVVPD